VSTKYLQIGVDKFSSCEGISGGKSKASPWIAVRHFR
jgi:hypothetical protein